MKNFKSKVSYIFSKDRINGREKCYKESIYYGVSKVYADISDARKAGVKIDKKKISPSGAWYYPTKKDLEKILIYLEK